MIEIIKQIKNLEELQKLYSDTFGKNGSMTDKLKKMKDLSDGERAELNKEKENLQAAFKKRQEEIENEKLMSELASDKVDATRSPESAQAGKIHPLSRALKEMSAVFQSMGYKQANGPEIETEWYNFIALNTPDYHPARDMQSTFFIDGTKNLLRTQTSAVQIREMEKNGVPIKIFCPGRTYRRDALDATHSPMFHQIEILVVDSNVTLQNLISDIRKFCELFFERDVEIRIRPSYFPFTEPSIEVDVRFKDRWLELGGAGMVHPKVLKNVGVDPEKFQGYAFGFGWDRLAMIKYNLSNIRNFFGGDIRWLRNN